LTFIRIDLRSNASEFHRHVVAFEIREVQRTGERFSFGQMLLNLTATLWLAESKRCNAPKRDSAFVCKDKSIFVGKQGFRSLIDRLKISSPRRIDFGQMLLNLIATLWLTKSKRCKAP
jgi:hypothetical protein